MYLSDTSKITYVRVRGSSIMWRAQTRVAITPDMIIAIGFDRAVAHVKVDGIYDILFYERPGFDLKYVKEVIEGYVTNGVPGIITRQDRTSEMSFLTFDRVVTDQTRKAIAAIPGVVYVGSLVPYNGVSVQIAAGFDWDGDQIVEKVKRRLKWPWLWWWI